MTMRKKVLHGLAWSFSSQAGKSISQFVITAILARLLLPGDFGLLSMAMVFIGLLTVLNEKGFSSALIQNESIQETHYSSVFWLNVLIGVFMTAAFVALARPIAVFYKMPALENILEALSVNILIASIGIVPRAILAKMMDFKKLAFIENIAVILSGATGISLAVSGYGVWSLVFQAITLNLVTALLLLRFSHWKPAFSFSLRAVRGLTGFSVSVMATFLLSYTHRNIDYLLIGRFLGAEALGFYTLAYKLMLYPVQNISWVVSKVLFPAFSRMQNDLERIRSAYLKSTKAISLITFPLLAGLLVLAPEFVRVVFGTRWETATGLIRIFCICGIVQSISTTVGDIFLSQGKISLHLKLNGAFTVLISVCIVAGLSGGIYGVSILYTMGSLLWAPYTLWKGNQLIGLKMFDFSMPLIRSLALSVAMTLLLFGLKSVSALGDTAMLILLSSTGGIFYFFLLWKFERDFILDIYRKPIASTGSGPDSLRAQV